jgi:hypothetical protein
MSMTPEAFHMGSQRLPFASEPEALLVALRSSPPVHRVSGWAENSTGRSPSPKLQCTIPFESEQVECCAFTEAMEVMSSQMQEDDLPQTVCQSVHRCNREAGTHCSFATRQRNGSRVSALTRLARRTCHGTARISKQPATAGAGKRI